MRRVYYILIITVLSVALIVVSMMYSLQVLFPPNTTRISVADMHEVNYQQFKSDSTFYTSPDIYNGYITNISFSDNTIDIFISWSYGATNSAYYSFTFDPATFGLPLDFVKVGEPVRAFIPTNQESTQPIDIKDARSIKYRYLVFNSDQSIRFEPPRVLTSNEYEVRYTVAHVTRAADGVQNVTLQFDGLDQTYIFSYKDWPQVENLQDGAEIPCFVVILDNYNVSPLWINVDNSWQVNVDLLTRNFMY